jgi:quercetin dioxygenase-like cupin family protein
VLKPGARHVNHRHHNCDEFFIVLKGKGMIYTDHGDKPSSEGDVVYSPRDCWHGFNNTVATTHVGTALRSLPSSS